ncbi:hypothetical protein GKE56_03315 [Nostocoides sp. HKS02]|nr:hypothetical protein GKE56_03315 [Tetrasphaera sp. HKS02]
MTTRALGSSVARAAGVIAVATLLARMAGFARTLVFSGSVGTSGVGDTYQSVNMLPNIVYEVAAGGVLAAVAVPLVAGQLALGRDREADQAASALLTWAVVVLAPLSVLLALTAPWVSRALLGSVATSSEVELGSRMLVLFAPQVLLYGLGIVLGGVLQARRRFLAAALAPLLSSLVVIVAYLLYAVVAGNENLPATVSAPAVWTLAGGTTLGVVVLSLPLLVPVVRAGVQLRPTLQFPRGWPSARARWRVRGCSRSWPSRRPCSRPCGWRTTAPTSSGPSTSTPTSRRCTSCRMPSSPSRSRPRPSRRWRTRPPSMPLTVSTPPPWTPPPWAPLLATPSPARSRASCCSPAGRPRCSWLSRAPWASSSRPSTAAPTAGADSHSRPSRGRSRHTRPASSGSGSPRCSPGRCTSADGPCMPRWRLQRGGPWPRCCRCSSCQQGPARRRRSASSGSRRPWA